MTAYLVSAHMPWGTTSFQVEADDWATALVRAAEEPSERVVVEVFPLHDETTPARLFHVQAESPSAAVRAAIARAEQGGGAEDTPQV